MGSWYSTPTWEELVETAVLAQDLNTLMRLCATASHRKHALDKLYNVIIPANIFNWLHDGSPLFAVGKLGSGDKWQSHNTHEFYLWDSRVSHLEPHHLESLFLQVSVPSYTWVKKEPNGYTAGSITPAISPAYTITTLPGVGAMAVRTLMKGRVMTPCDIHTIARLLPPLDKQQKETIQLYYPELTTL